MEDTKKIALVTGGAGTMGRSVAQGLLEDGMKVVLVDINLEAVKDVSAKLGEDTYAYALDISDWAACQRIVEQIQKEVGSIDVLVNNAGILSNNKLESTSEEEWHKVMSVNLDGAFYLSKLIVPGMKQKKWGRIINVSSYAAKCGGITAGTSYSVSKAALIGLTFSIAAETAGFGITSNGIAPAYVRTPMVDKQLTEEQRQAVVQKIPVKRFCEPEEFTHVVRFLASPKAGFITGEIIDQNGGMQFD